MTRQFGPLLDALPFGQEWREKRWDRVKHLIEPMRDFFGFAILHVNPSGSMSPAVVGGESVLIEEYPKNLCVGDVVGFFMDEIDPPIFHRIIRIEEVNGEKRIYTKGDSNPKQDKGYRTPEQIAGRWVYIFNRPLAERYRCSDYFWRKGKPWVDKPSVQVD